MKLSNILIVFVLTGMISTSCSSSKKTTKSGTDSTETTITSKETKKEENSTQTTKVVNKPVDDREKLLKEAIDSYPDSLVVLLNRTACYGRCPVYSVKIYSSGYTTYEGKANVEMTGNYTTIIDKSKIEEIYTKVDVMDFYKMNNIYDSNVTDFPSTHLYVKKDNNKKQIIDRHGGPKELKDLASYIDELVKSADWKKQ